MARPSPSYVDLIAAFHDLIDERRPWPEVLAVLLAAHREAPHQPQPVDEIVRHYRLLGHHELADLLVASGRPNPTPIGDGVVAPPERTRVRLAPSWTTADDLTTTWRRQAGAGGRWGSVELTTEDDAEYVVVLNHPGATPIDDRRSIVFQMEPTSTLEQSGGWADPPPGRFVQVRHRRRFATAVEWHLGLSYEELLVARPDKDRLLSAVVSARDDLPMHRIRLDLLRQLEAAGVAIDIYGFTNDAGFAGYQGSLPFLDKGAGLLPYRYTIAIENSIEPNHFTEKVVDALLAECLPFYLGCPNLADHLDPEVVIALDPDPARSEAIIRAAIADDAWGRRLAAIRAEKRRILDEVQVLPTVERVIAGHRLVQQVRIVTVNLDRRPDRWHGFLCSARRVLGPDLAARIERFAAVDGLHLQADEEVRHLFRSNRFADRRAVMGCALSHLALWTELAGTRADSAPWLILEDDARFDPDIVAGLVEVCGRLASAPEPPDLVLLGHAAWTDEQAVRSHDPRAPWRLEPMRWDEYLGGTFAYLVTPRGARRLVSLVQEHGIQDPIDWFLSHHASDLRAWRVMPHLVRSPLARPGSTTDSDIQHDLMAVR